MLPGRLCLKLQCGSNLLLHPTSCLRVAARTSQTFATAFCFGGPTAGVWSVAFCRWVLRSQTIHVPHAWMGPGPHVKRIGGAESGQTPVRSRTGRSPTGPQGMQTSLAPAGVPLLTRLDRVGKVRVGERYRPDCAQPSWGNQHCSPSLPGLSPWFRYAVCLKWLGTLSSRACEKLQPDGKALMCYFARM